MTELSTPAPARPLADAGAIVSGGSRGIGRAVVERLARDGASVVFGYRSDADAAEALVATLRAEGCRVEAVCADLAQLDGVRTLFARAAELLDGIDVVVNNAGAVYAAAVADTAEEDYDRVMAVNAKAVFFAMQEAARRLRDGGRIVNISSINTRMASPTTALYSASKAAVEHFTAIAAQELGARGITVNAIAPGPTDTQMLHSAMPPEALETVVGMTALGRLGLPEDIAGAVALLVGPDGRWITGQTIAVSGGLG